MMFGNDIIQIKKFLCEWKNSGWGWKLGPLALIAKALPIELPVSTVTHFVLFTIAYLSEFFPSGVDPC